MFTTEHKGSYDGGRFMPAYRHSFNLPLPPSSVEVELAAYLKEVGLEPDARALWMGYPNLKSTSMALLSWVGKEWPSLDNPKESSAFNAIASAILEVKAGLEAGETDRRFVVARFHNGLTSIAADICAYTAWGCKGTKAIDQWTPFHERFDNWMNNGDYDKVIFAMKREANDMDRLGLVWKMRAHIAPLHDVGVIHKFGERG